MQLQDLKNIPMWDSFIWIIVIYTKMARISPMAISPARDFRDIIVKKPTTDG